MAARTRADAEDAGPPAIEVRGLELGYGGRAVLRGVDFEVPRGSIFVIMGPSGCGKSTLLKSMIGLIEPVAGEVLHWGEPFTRAGPEARARLLRRCGVVYQKSALWSSMSLAENIELVLEEYTDLGSAERRELALMKLALVGLSGAEDDLPSRISGGMQKRAALARALALDPPLLVLDEPGAGLDPIHSLKLDELVLELRESLGSTVVIVTHELPSILTIATDSVYLDPHRRTVTARGAPRELLEHNRDPEVRAFLTRGAEAPA